MSFRVAARTLIHLGAELISSDAVALFELVKNGFDAGSSHVTINVVVRIPHQKARQLLERLESALGSHKDLSNQPPSIEELRTEILKAIDRVAPGSNSFARLVEQATGTQEIYEALLECNYLVVGDTGEGMSLDTLEDAFLTIGTRSRLETKARRVSDGSSRPVLGEKGVGRLSSMRLGTQLHVESSTVGETSWNVLDIDWSIFSHNSDALLDDFHIEAHRGHSKEDPNSSGTRLVISGLTSPWTNLKLKELVDQQFTKFTDPFTDRSIFPIQLVFNGEPVPIPRFNRILLDNAHATVKATFGHQNQDRIRLSGQLEYKSRQRVFALDGAHLTSISESTMNVLESLGPFQLEIYWYNRRILSALEGIGDRSTVLQVVRDWGGGVMVFRDGFRVLPYGGLDEDWLDLDRRALSSGGYKINRLQIIGRLLISNVTNPALTDQTNREGLRDCDEKRALINLLKHVIQDELRPFLNEIDKEDKTKAREPLSLDELGQRVQDEERQIRINVRQLVQRVPELKREQSLLTQVNEAVNRLTNLMSEVQEIADSYESGRGQLLNLAGIGLSVEVLAHELNRATEHVLRTLAGASNGKTSSPIQPTLNMLEAQLKTLQRRLRVLDPISTSGRQRRERFDVVSLVQDTIEDHRDRFARESITCDLQIRPDGSRGYLRIRAVKGMIIQVLGNLLDNSIYWLRQQKMLEPNQNSRITIAVDTQAQQLLVTDNGPGVATDSRERVFEAFYTTKPPRQGKGLGLFIGREIARYHGADLYIAEPTNQEDQVCHTFVLTLGEMKP